MKTLQEFHDFHTTVIRSVYDVPDHAADPEYDMTPVIVVQLQGGEIHVCTLVGAAQPNDAAKKALDEVTKHFAENPPVAVSFAAPSWVKTPEGERVGECVLLQTENAVQQIISQLEVTRNPLTVGEVKTPPHGVARVTFLYHDTRTKQ